MVLRADCSRGRFGPPGKKGAGNRHQIFRGASKFRVIGRQRAGQNRQIRAKRRVGHDITACRHVMLMNDAAQRAFVTGTKAGEFDLDESGRLP